MSQTAERARKPRRRELRAGDEVRRFNGERAVVLDRSSSELILRDDHPSRRGDEWVVVVFISGTGSGLALPCKRDEFKVVRRPR